MRGTARTVFRGSQSEEFNVEILGVLPGGVGPRQDLIIGRISGGPADRTSVFAGMSGSPVYIDGRLVGAISYSFPFSKEPICGITPIEQMIQIFEKKDNSARTGVNAARAVSVAELTGVTWDPRLPVVPESGVVSGFAHNSMMAAAAGQTFRPIATPLTFNGFSQASLDAFAPQLLQAGLVPVAAVGGAAAITPMKAASADTLVGGTSVSMQLTRGDYSLAAAGTVTLRDGDKIYAFGHPFLSLGTSDLPMSESHVIAVVPNLNNSFKLAVPDAMVGSMTQDRATGVFGKLGVSPRMIPVRLNLETSRGQKQTLNFEVAKDDFLTPLLLNISIYNALLSQERGIGDATVSARGEIRLDGHAPLRIGRRFAGPQATQAAAAAFAIPVNVLLRSKFDDLRISGIDVDLVSTDGSSTAVVERVALDRTQLRAGETADVQIYARTNNGRVIMQRAALTIPKDAAAGAMTVVVGDGAAIQQTSSLQQFVPSSLAELIKTFGKVKYADRLYMQLFRTSGGAIIGSSEMPNLPPSMLATLNNDRTSGGVKPSVQTTVAETELPAGEFLITGQQSVNIEVIR